VRTNEGAEAISFKLETFPLLLQRAGYRTGYLGKYHMGESAVPRPGFDRWVVVPGQGRYVDPVFNIDGREETKHPGRFTAVTGVLIDNWQAMTTPTQEEARRRTRTSMLTDGNFNSGYAIMGEDGRLTPILKADRERVAAYLAAESRETDLRVRAEFYDEGLGAWLAGLWPILGRPDTVFTTEGDTLVMEAGLAAETPSGATGSASHRSGDDRTRRRSAHAGDRQAQTRAPVARQGGAHPGRRRDAA
jgi:hypothetical protein